MGPLAYYMADDFFIPNPPLCPLQVKTIYPSVACPGIRRGAKNLKGLFFAFQFFKGGPAQKIAEKMIFQTKKVAKYR